MCAHTYLPKDRSIWNKNKFLTLKCIVLTVSKGASLECIIRNFLYVNVNISVSNTKNYCTQIFDEILLRSLQESEKEGSKFICFYRHKLHFSELHLISHITSPLASIGSCNF